MFVNVNQPNGLLKCACLNVSGLKQKLLIPEFTVNINSYDLFCVTETHLDNTDIVDIEGYTYFSKNREQRYLRKSGGIGVYVKKCISSHVN